VADEFGQPPVAIDASRDNKLVSDLEREGLDIRPVKFTSGRKQTLVENLAAGMEAGEVVVPSGSILEAELSVYEFSTTRAGNVRYSHPDGHHDDTVDALMMAFDLPAEAGVATARVDLGAVNGADSSTGTGTDATIGDLLPDPTQ
jgi:Terminase-like family.